MPYKKGESGNPKGRTPGSGRNQFCKKWAEKKGLPFLARVAEGKEKDVDGFGKPCPVKMAVRTQVAEWLADQGLGRAPQRHEITGGDGAPLNMADLLRTPDDEPQP